MRFLTQWVLAAFFAASCGLAWVAAHIIPNYSDPQTPLQMFYVEGLSHTLGEASVLFLVASAFFAIYALSLGVRRGVSALADEVGSYLRSCSLFSYALISCGATAVLLFFLNAQGILHGTFLIDDYKMYAIATERGVWELLFIPINDHVIPLFWLELKTLFSFIGPHPPLLNFPLFVPAIVAIAGAATLLRQLRFGPSTLAVLLGIFASTSIVGHQLYGFYAVAPYFQVLAVFVLSLICFTASQQRPRLRRVYQLLSLALLAATLLLESGAVWTPVAYVLFVYAFHILTTTSWRIGPVLRAHAKMLVAVLAILVVYATYLIALPHFTTVPFFGFNRLPISLGTVLELYRVLTEGTLLSFFAPRLGLIVSQPRFAAFIVPWHAVMFVLFVSLLVLIVYAVRKGTLRARVLVPYFMLVSLGAALLVAIARPSSNAAAFYRDQNLLFPLFFLALALAVFAHEWIQNTNETSRRLARGAIVAALLILVFVSQHVFSFYKEQYLDDIAFNQTLVAQLEETVTPALNEISNTPTPLVVPSLGALFIRGDGNHQLPELSAFSSFIGVRNVEWIPTYLGPYYASTSPAFIEALTHDERLRQWYLADGEVREICAAEPWGAEDVAVSPTMPTIAASSLDPAEKHALHFDLEAHDAPEKIFIDISFRNDFDAVGARAHIRIDQYTNTADTAERRYVCSVNLDEIPAFALSRTVSNFTLTVTTPGEYTLHGAHVDVR